MELSLNLYLTTALAVIVYYLGNAIRKRVYFMQKYCIPAPVVGGIIIAVLVLALRVSGVLTLQMDTTLQEVFMLVFFCSIGFNARLNILKKGGIGLVIMVVAVAGLCVIQNLVGAGIVSMFGMHPLLGTAIGSVPLVGGHGTVAAFGRLIEEMGVPYAETAAYAAATYGLVAGCMIGGPIAYERIKKMDRTAAQGGAAQEAVLETKQARLLDQDQLMLAVSLLLLCVGMGTIISAILDKLMTFSAAVGCLLGGCIVRNICDAREIELPDEEIQMTGNISLGIFLAMAMMSMKLWELAALAVPMIITLLVQTVLVALFAYFVIFKVMGKDYDAAVMAAGTCGFGLGATPNAIANMDAVTRAYGASARAFLIVPIVGSMFTDLVNSTVITIFMNVFG